MTATRDRAMKWHIKKESGDPKTFCGRAMETRSFKREDTPNFCRGCVRVAQSHHQGSTDVLPLWDGEAQAWKILVVPVRPATDEEKSRKFQINFTGIYVDPIGREEA